MRLGRARTYDLWVPGRGHLVNCDTRIVGHGIIFCVEGWRLRRDEKENDKERVRSVTRHIRRTRCSHCVAAQLPSAVVAPALDPALAHNRARVLPSQGDGDGGDACRGKGGGDEQKWKLSHTHASARTQTPTPTPLRPYEYILRWGRKTM